MSKRKSKRTKNRNRKGRQARRRVEKTQLNLEALDKREMLDASGAISEAFAVPDTVAEQIQSASDQLRGLDLANAVPSVQSESIRHELVFVDAGVEDQDALLSDLQASRPGVLREVIHINADSDGLLQIANHLEGRTDIDAIHVISHGEQAELRLGNAVISQGELKSEYGDALGAIGASLDEDADLLIYGCNFGGGKVGEEAVATLSALTGADVAASDDLTGAEELGGDWDLEVSTGLVEAQSLESLSFAGVLVSQNEVLINVLYDGTPGFDAADPSAPTGSAPEAHTPGDDGGPNNLVVRTHDQFAVRVDWNVNEDAATNVVLEVTLPPFASWSPDQTGMFAGCDPATSSFTDPQTLVCNVGDQVEGSHGVIRPVATLNEALDNMTFDVTSRLTTDADAAGVSDGLDQNLTVSEAPFVDYIKGEPTVSPVLNNSTEDGYVALFPFTFVDYSQASPPAVGVGPINDGVNIELFDHMWNLTPSVRLATPGEMTLAGFAGSNCGDYAQGGAYVTGNGTWACGATTTGTGGYPVVPITVSNFTSNPFPATLADTTANAPDAPQISSGQIAVWLSKSEVDDAIDDPTNGSGSSDASFDNSIVADDETTVIAARTDVIDAPGQGTSGPSIEGSPENNSAGLTFGATITTGSVGFRTGHDIKFLPGPLQLVDVTYASGHVQMNHDGGDPDDGGLGQIPGSSSLLQGTVAGADSIGQVSRGQVLTVSSRTHAVAVAEGVSAAFSSCTAFDTAHYEVTSLPASLTVREAFTTNGGSISTTGYTTTAPSDGIAHVVSGDTVTRELARAWFDGFGGAEREFPVVVEVTNAPLPRYNGSQTGINDDALTCDSADAGSLGWVNASADLTDFDPNNDGDFELITLARVRAVETIDLFPSAEAQAVSGQFDAAGMTSYFNVRVKDDLAVNTDAQELFAFTSHTFTADPWDGVNAPVITDSSGNPSTSCAPYGGGNWTADDQAGDGVNSATGWCNNRFHDDGANSFDTTDVVDWPQHSGGTARSGNWVHASGTVVEIVGASLAVNKINVNGPGDVANNGQTVQFTITPSVTGGATEALSNVRVTDLLPANYEFVQFIDLPDVPHDCSQSGQTVSCQYSDPAGATGNALPAGLPGGWPGTDDASFTIEVLVTGAIAHPTDPVILTNRARAQSSGLGAWDPVAGEFPFGFEPANQDVSAYASSFLPLPADEASIVKAVNAHEGPCELHPSEDPPPAGWGDRCSMIEYEGNMTFTLSLTNEGNTAFTDVRFVDVFPHNDDAAIEDGDNTSITDTLGGSPQTHGDGRTPASDFGGTLGFVSLTGADTVLVSGDDPLTISRDPDVAVTETIWCTVGGTMVHAGDAIGAQACPTNPEDVTATFSVTDGPLNPGDTLTHTLTLDAEDHECNDIWTNTFGAQTNEIFLPIRSNDVSVMVNCEHDLALEKTVDPAFVPGPDWITEGSTTVDFLIEITNQGDPVEDFDITDYVDTSVFTFDPANNTATTTGGTANGGAGLPFTWDTTDLAAPVALVDGFLDVGETVTIPVTLIIEDATGTLENWAEISRFDTDGDPSNGDSDPTNPNNPSTGPLTDEDSTPDDDQAGDNQPTGAGAPGDGVIDEDGLNGGDEDDHDVAGIPIYDLELIKTPGTPTFDFSASPPTVAYDITVSNQGNADAYLVDVTDYGAPGLTFVSATSTAAGFTDANPTFTIDGPIAPGASETITVVYEMDLSQAPFTNAAEISAFDADSDPDNPANPLAVDIDSTPDATNDDDVIDHDVQNYDPDGDGNLNELTPGDEDDHDIEVVAPYDLSLIKTIESVNTPLSPDGSVTMLLTIENQAAPVGTVDITDYIDATMWQPFDPALNTGGAAHANSTAAAGFSFTWDATDPLNPVASITPDVATDRLQFGETVVIPITLQPVDNFADVAPLSNVAEISNFDNDTDPTNGDASDGTISDLDSNPDAMNGNGPGEDPDADMVDDETGENGLAGGDEDDHDGILIPVYDLELIKTVRSPSVDTNTTPWESTFDITVTNQGTEDAFLVDVTEYAPPGLTYDAAATAALWAAEGITGTTDAAPTFTIAGPIAPGATATFPVVYEITDISQAPFENAAEISAFDSDNDPDNPADPLAVDVDSTPDATNDDDVIDHDVQNYDPDGDGNLNELTPGDEDDHDIEVVAPYDLALTKTFESADTPLTPDGSVTMLITIENQAAPVGTIDITDYIDATMWQPFDATLNPGGAVHANSTAAAGYSFTWDAADPLNPVALLVPDAATDQLAFGETVVVPITLQPVDNFADVAPLSNVAEISNFDNDTDPDNGDASDGTISDLDSTPDGENGNGPGEDPGADMVNDETGENGLAGGDEDDHDGVLFPFYDLELVKTLGTPSYDFTASPPTAAFELTVSNQGSEDAFLVDITEYPPAGLTYDAAATAAAWSAAGLTGVTDAAPTFTIAGPIAPGASVTIPVVYQMTDLSQAPFENAAEISSFDSDSDPDNEPDPFAFDVDSTPDATNDDDVIDQTDPDYDPDADGNLNEETPGDEDDHDIAIAAPYDLALTKTIGTVNSPLSPDGSVTMLLTVENQAAPVSTFDITDYIDATMWQPFDPALNPGGAMVASSTAAAGFSYTWDATDPLNPVAQITPNVATDQLQFGESVVIEITLQPVENFGDVAPLSNVAEISNFDNDTDPDNGDASDGTISDLDSLTDSENGNGPGEDPDADMVDDETGENGLAGGDEDDHDGIVIPIYDLELVKVLRDPALDQSTSPWQVAFDITVSNQGTEDAFLVDVTEYAPAGLAFDAAATTALWTSEGLAGLSESGGVFTIAGPIAPDASVTFPVVYDITDPAASPFENAAEISAFDSDSDPDNEPDPLAVDVDSNPDGVNDDDVIDQTDPNYDPDGDGNTNEFTAGDEDDHDVAEFVMEFDLALEKTVDPTWAPGADWVTEGTSTIDFLIEVTNQATQVEDFDVTEYVDTSVFSFNLVDNPAGTTGGAASLPFTWDVTDPTKPVVSVDGVLATGESVTIPVTLVIEDSAGPLDNWAEISYFDSDGDPSNGDSDPTNPNNQSGPLVDVDSTPDDDQAGDNQPTGPGAPGDGEIDNAGGDEDDHDVAGVPLYDLELIKEPRDPGVDTSVLPWHATFDITVTNQGDADAFLVDVTEYPPAGLAFDVAATTALWAAEGLTDISENGGVFTIDGPIAPGSAMTFPIVYDIVDTAASSYENAAEISAFDDNDDPNDTLSPFAVDVDSNPDGTNDDDVIDQTDPNYDPDGDGNLNETTSGDEDDHDIATLEVLRDSTVGVAKDSIWDDATDTARFVFNLEHFGNLQAVNMSMTEDLDVIFGAGNYTVAPPTLLSGPGTVSTNPSFDGSTDMELIGAGSTMLPGETAEIEFLVTVTEIVDLQGNGLGQFMNQVTLDTEDIFGNSYTDDSVDGTDPDPGGDGDPTNDDSPSLGELTPVGYVAAAKTATPAGDASGVVFDFFLEHIGNTPVSVSLVEDLAATFITGGTFNVVSVDYLGGSPTVTANGMFNGTTDLNLLAAGSTMSPGETAHIQVAVELDGVFGTLENQATVTSTDGSGREWVDLSQDGTDPDPDDDLDPRNNDDPTPFVLGLSTIEGTTYVDLNNDGIQDPNEVGIPGVTIVLTGTDVNGNPVEITTVTDADGNYIFDMLPPGNYTLTQIQPDSFFDGQDTAGDNGTVAGNNTIDVVVTPGINTFPEQNFGERGRDPSFTGKDPFLASNQGDDDGTTVLTPPSSLSDLVTTRPSAEFQIAGRHLILNGLHADDVLDIQAGTTEHRISVNQVEYRFDTSSVDKIQVFARGGNDRVTVRGSELDDRVVLMPNSARLTSSHYDIEVKSSEFISAYGGGGEDSGFLVDSEGRDVFVVTERFATMRELGNSYKNELRGFEMVTGNAINGGYDLATIYDTSADDFVKLRPGFAQLFGDGMEFRASGFDSVETRAVSRGNDRVEFIDSVDNDVFLAEGTTATMVGGGFRSKAFNFENAKAVHQNGGNDVAQFHDTAGNDEFTASVNYARMNGTGYRNEATGFSTVNAYAQNGGEDKATLTDSTGDDIFVSSPTVSSMRGNGYLNRVEGFEIVSGVSTAGGNDTAYLHDSAGNDTYVARPTFSELRGDGFANRALNFETVYAKSDAGGEDIAVFFGGIDLNERFIDRVGRAQMHDGPGGTYRNVADNFEVIQAHGGEGDVAEVNQVAGGDMLTGRDNTARLSGSRSTMVKNFDRVQARSEDNATSDIDDVDFIFEKFGTWRDAA